MDEARGHARWVRVSHWIGAASVLVLAVTGVLILMVHPRLYWGEAGNDLTPALLELPISRNHQHGGWDTPRPFFARAGAPVSASRTFEIFNQNGWGRSLHFLAAWILVVPGAIYLLSGLLGGHFRSHVWPGARELAPRVVWRHVVDHLRLRIPPATGGPRYNVLQKIAYSSVIFVAAPLMVLTGLAMSPAIGAAYAVAAAPVRRLPVGADGPLLRVRGARAVRARARRDGGRVRLPPPDAGDDRGRVR